MTNYQIRRNEDYKTDDAMKRKQQRRKAALRKGPASSLKPLPFFHISTREWTDTPEDRAAVAAILKGGAR